MQTRANRIMIRKYCPWMQHTRAEQQLKDSWSLDTMLHQSSMQRQVIGAQQYERSNRINLQEAGNP